MVDSNAARNLICCAWWQDAQTETIVNGIGEGAPRLDAEEIGIWLLRPCRDAGPVRRTIRRIFEGNGFACCGIGKNNLREAWIYVEAIDPSGV